VVNKMLFVLGSLLSAIIFSVMLFSDYYLFAQPRGCCKQRDSREDQDWYRNGLDFRECQELNQRRDGRDDVFDRTGFVWWDRDCRE
jgi:hypothetical protein